MPLRHRVVAGLGPTGDISDQPETDSAPYPLHVSHQRTGTASGCDSSKLFRRIQADPDVCPNCFRQTHDRIERNYAVDWVWDEERQEHDFWPRYIDRGEFRRRNPEETTREPVGEASRGLSTICECGSGGAQIRPLRKSTFFEYLDHLAERVQDREEVVEFDEQVFRDTAERLKSTPEEQFADDRIFEHAVAASVTTE